MSLPSPATARADCRPLPKWSSRPSCCVAVDAFDRLVQRLRGEAHRRRGQMQALPGAAGGDGACPCPDGRAPGSCRAPAHCVCTSRVMFEPVAVRGRGALVRHQLRARSHQRREPAVSMPIPSRCASTSRLPVRNQRALSADICGSAMMRSRRLDDQSTPVSLRAWASVRKTTRTSLSDTSALELA